MSISTSFLYPGVQAELIAAGRKARAERALQRSLKPHAWVFDEQHHAGRTALEASLRSDAAPARDLPSAFGEPS